MTTHAHDASMAEAPMPSLSSRSAKANQRLHAIQEAACRLVIARGYDGFTMDELAEHVGVSRRTLFNYVPDKASAVVGPADHDGHAERALITFRDGGPTGRLMADLHHAIEAVTDDATHFEDKSAHHHELVEAAIAADPKVLAIVTERFEQITVTLEQAVTEREGWPDGDLRARALAATTLALIKVTLSELTSSGAPTVDFTSTFRRVVAADAALHADPGA